MVRITGTIIGDQDRAVTMGWEGTNQGSLEELARKMSVNECLDALI